MRTVVKSCKLEWIEFNHSWSEKCRLNLIKRSESLVISFNDDLFFENMSPQFLSNVTSNRVLKIFINKCEFNSNFLSTSWSWFSRWSFCGFFRWFFNGFFGRSIDRFFERSSWTWLLCWSVVLFSCRCTCCSCCFFFTNISIADESVIAFAFYSSPFWFATGVGMTNSTRVYRSGCCCNNNATGCWCCHISCCSEFMANVESIVHKLRLKTLLYFFAKMLVARMSWDWY